LSDKLASKLPLATNSYLAPELNLTRLLAWSIWLYYSQIWHFKGGFSMARPVWFVNLIKKTFSDRFLLARLTKVPGIRSIVDYALFHRDDLIYLPKDGVIRIDQSVISPADVVLPSQVVKHFIRQAKYYWIMDDCLCRDASQCQDYPTDLGCLFMGEAVLGINPKLGRRVTADEALDHVRLCRETGLVHMIGRNKLDTMWLGVGPGTKLLTICNCCPCCCLWKMLPDLDQTIGRKVSRMPGVSLVVTERCTGCGTCTEGVCFASAIAMEGDKALISTECRGCGRCAEICPEEAIELTFSGRLSIEETVERLSSLVDVS
jgi:formate hydrogenlyase subunit 6/NADH:ubiquinone oxidoreductase subunit I